MLVNEKKVDFGQIKYIDFDKIKQIFYDNLYFEKSGFVLKIPLMSLIKHISNDDIKIEKFDLMKYTYLLHYK